MFNWLTKLLMQTPHQGNCAGCGSANRDRMEAIRKQMTEGDLKVEYEEALSSGGCCCCHDDVEEEHEHECCGGVNCKDKDPEEEKTGCCGGGCGCH